MKIRSVTIFNGRPGAHSSEAVELSGKAAQTIRKRLQDAGFEVQTTRLALAPAYTWMSGLDVEQSVAEAQIIEELSRDAGMDFVSLGPVAYDLEHVDEIRKLPELIAQTTSIFATAPISLNGVIRNWALQPISDAIKRIAETTENGFGNLRFAALAECNAGIPFFPAAYASSGDFSCALALECADLALDAATRMPSAHEAMAELTRLIEHHASGIEAAMRGVDVECGIAFTGCDWSLAPHPDVSCSIGAAIEKLSGVSFGEWGTLSAVALLTQAIRNASVRHVGFSGVFLPLLEDDVLARRTRDMSDMQKLLLYCSVCGSGLDTVPLAGDVKAESIAALLKDVATLATALKKPLTARLMPIPGLKAGEPTRFDFPYVVNGYTLAL